MFLICFIKNLSAAFLGCEELCFGQLVELFTHRVGGNIEFICQFAQIRPCIWIKEKTGKEFDAGPG